MGLITGGFRIDVPECAPAVYACGCEPAATRAAARTLAEQVRSREMEFVLEIFSIHRALEIVKATSPERGRPVILVDTQDNPGAGGNADTMTLIRALIDARLEHALAGIICDPQAAARAHEAGQVRPSS